MSSKVLVPIGLWGLVLVVGLSMYLPRNRGPVEVKSPIELGLVDADDSRVSNTKDGRAIANTPWTHLPDVERFQLTNQEGQTVDSLDLAGTPYVVSFFFSSCPSFCRDLNKQLRQSNDAVRNQDIRFLTLSVEPSVDTVPVLKKYAGGFDAQADRWSFLTGPLADIKAFGEKSFNVVIDRDTHTDDILLVDKWGRYRDRFKWSSATDMKRFNDVVQEVAAETEPPMDRVIQTRNVFAGVEPPKLNSVAWLRDFHLQDCSGGEFFSRQMTGNVWLAHFGLPTDGIKTARQVSAAAELLPQPIKVVSILTDGLPTTDAEIRAAFDSKQVQLTVGNAPAEKIRRICQEYFGVDPDSKNLGNTIAVVDRFGGVRKLVADVDGMTAQALQQTFQPLLKKLADENQPVIDY